MDARSKIGAGVLGVSAVVTGAVDATTLREVPLERVERIAEERVEARQIENRVETTFPWKDQNGLKVVYDMGEPTISERFSDKRKREVITETVDFGDGGFKIDILLNEKPDTNRFCYLIEGAEQYEFFYQPSLTEEYPQTANGLGNNTWRVDEETGERFEFDVTNGVERPESIVGSLAVYHKELKNHEVGKENYATGKVMHIPRPQVWELNDEENTKEWAELSYENGELCVTARQEFLNDATYPVRIDPTFGYSSSGASVQYTNSDEDAYGNKGPAVDGTLDSVTAYVRRLSGSGSSYSEYIFSESSNESSALFHIFPNITYTTTPTARTQTASGQTLSASAGTQYVAVGVSYGVTAGVMYDGGSGTNGGRFYGFSGSWADESTRNYSVYATYTASGGGGSAPTPDIIWFD